MSISFDVERIKVENHQSERFGWKSWLVDSGKWKQSTTVAHNKGLLAILDQVLLVRVKNAKNGQTHWILLERKKTAFYSKIYKFDNSS